MEPQRTRYDRERFTLPEGRAAPADRTTPASDRELRDCPCCRSGLVQPVEMLLCDDGGRQVERRCPECEWRGGGVFTAEAVERYERELDEARASLEGLLRRIERASVERGVEGFARALAQDHVVPEDF